MDFFRQAVAAATDLAAKAGENAKVFVDTVASDARGIAGETQIAVKQVQQGIGRRPPPKKEPDAAELANARISDELVDHVRALTYASFRENEDAFGAASEEGYVLEPWQLRHATLILQMCHELEDLRFVLSPKRMSEARFWQIYFFLARSYIEAAAAAPRGGAHVPRQPSPATASPGDATSAGKTYHPGTSWSNITSCRDGWESEEWEKPPDAEAPQATPDDLDAYLADMMDGDEQGAKGDSEGDDLEQYLDELNDGSEATSDVVERVLEDERNGDLLADDGDIEDQLRALDVK